MHPEIPEKGLLVADIYRLKGIDPMQARERLQQAANAAGLPLGIREKTYNSRMAQELCKWAEEKDYGDAYRRAIFYGYFVESRNIGHMDTLIKMIETLNLPSLEARDALEKRIYKKAVDGDWARTQSLGITAVPTMLLNRKILVGAQSYDTMEWFLMTNNVAKR